MKKISLIGLGRFGKLVAKILKEDFEVLVTDKVDKEKEAQELGVEWVSLKEAASQKIIILTVPISKLEDVLLKIKPFLKEETLIIDTCSVKEYPLHLMEKILPEKVEFIGTHPLFGPDSFHEKDRKVVICQGRSSKLEKVKKYLQRKGFKVIVTTPQEHDQKIAQTLALVHFLGRALLKMNLKQEEIKTLGYKKLLEILETVEHDTPQLFYDMHHYNPYAKEVREKFLESLKNWRKN